MSINDGHRVWNRPPTFYSPPLPSLPLPLFGFCNKRKKKNVSRGLDSEMEGEASGPWYVHPDTETQRHREREKSREQIVLWMDIGP